MAGSVDFPKLACACGYGRAVGVSTVAALERELVAARGSKELCFIEVKCAIGARRDLGRPTTTPGENRKIFMESLRDR